MASLLFDLGLLATVSRTTKPLGRYHTDKKETKVCAVSALASMVDAKGVS